jgi:hypothetical protein
MNSPNPGHIDADALRAARAADTSEAGAAARAADAARVAHPPADNTPLPPMTQQDFSNLAGALSRYHELRDLGPAVIVTPTSKGEEANRLAEIGGLESFLSNELLNRAPELLGCWQAIKNEYEPIVRAFIPVFRRVALAVTRQQEQVELAQAKAAAKTATNVIDITKA